MSKVFHIKYTTNEKVQREKYVLTARTIRPHDETISVFEITDGVIGEINRDTRNSYVGKPGEPGPAAYHYMYRAATAFQQHRRVLMQWKDSHSSRDESYMAYVAHLMHAAKKSTMVVDLTQKDFRDASVEFYPRLGFTGTWRTLKNNRIELLKVHNFGNAINDMNSDGND